MSTVPRLGIGVLSWHGYDSLDATLSSYRDGRLYDHADEVIVFLPEITDRGREVCRRHGVPFAGSAANLGILGGFKALATAMQAERVILLENDYRQIEPPAVVGPVLAAATADMDAGEADFVRLRHRRKPGLPWQGPKVARYFPPDDAPAGVRAAARLRRLVRPDKASRLIGTTPYLFDDADRRFPAAVGRTATGNFVVGSRHLPWSNNPTLIDRRFFLTGIIAEAEQRVGRRMVNGFPTIEIELNGGWWRNRNLRIGISVDGLFSQIRMGDRGY
ncbi:hypothetical protein [Segnochrobactrum spirostomi]|uniref:Glycosyltransferase family 2 protein n=1 Tax=Segnochrobactrum spirostomi TaxID=2608987 RepID=A0A6A7Y2E7_9HYPH|nr:hypothetical protein [Segnochrobactrum spirostomi]MQT13203.1 hypothetical protein [Segnochrobactrum spirostomi]